MNKDSYNYNDLNLEFNEQLIKYRTRLQINLEQLLELAGMKDILVKNASGEVGMLKVFTNTQDKYERPAIHFSRLKDYTTSKTKFVLSGELIVIPDSMTDESIIQLLKERYDKLEDYDE